MGTRNCIGRNLAYAEMRLILTKLLWHFDLELDEKKTGDWLKDMRAWALWEKPPLIVRLAEARR
jgi:cytochrome P450